MSLYASELPLRRRAAFVSIAVGISLFVIKFAAYALTGSAAVLSDALESVINVVASFSALFAILQSARPADESHPYGHGKVEFFSAGFEGALIVVAAVAIFWTAIPRFFDPTPLTRLDIGLVLLIIGGVVNYLLGVYLIRTGRKTHSDALTADGHHVHTDAYTSAGVIVGLLLVRFTGVYWIDPLVACLMGVNILFMGYRLLRSASAGLMDESDRPYLDVVTQALNQARVPEWIAPHHLRSWRGGAVRFVDFHLDLPRYWNLDQSHQVQKRLEEVVETASSQSCQVLIHFDPCVPDYCHLCAVDPCPVRSTPRQQQVTWTTELLMAGPPRRATDLSH